MTDELQEQLKDIPKPGQVLAGKYRVERIIGVGGMGAVVEATHLQLDQRVALKFLLRDAVRSPEIVTRFLREAKAATKIRTEHVVRILDVGTLETGAPYMVMEFLEGKDLDRLISEQARLPLSLTVDYVLQASEALAEAHAAGIIHRDLKPANLFLTHRADGSDCIKVLDFGISKLTLGGADSGVTGTQAFLGSPRYMSPEQIRSSRNVDVRTDIWSLGVILQELLSGASAFRAETVPELFAAILQDSPISLASVRPDVPIQFEKVIAKCLEKNPADRYSNLAELGHAMAPFGTSAAHESAKKLARILHVDPGHVDAVPSETIAAWPAAAFQKTVSAWGGTGQGERPKSRVRSGLVGVGIASVLAVLLLVMTRTKQDPNAVMGAQPSASTADSMALSASAAQPPQGISSAVRDVTPAAASVQGARERSGSQLAVTTRLAGPSPGLRAPKSSSSAASSVGLLPTPAKVDQRKSNEGLFDDPK